MKSANKTYFSFKLHGKSMLIDRSMTHCEKKILEVESVLKIENKNREIS